MDPLPPSIQHRLGRIAPPSSASRTRATAAGDTRTRGDRALERAPRSAVHDRGRITGLWDTPVDPLQLVWSLAREREDVSNF